MTGISVGSAARGIRRALPWIGGAAAGLAAVDVARYTLGSGPGNRGTVTGVLAGYRHVALFHLKNLHHPGRLISLNQSVFDALDAEKLLFHSGSIRPHNDDAADAFRHTFGGALTTYRMAHDRGMPLDEARAWVLEGGIAHENDSQLVGEAYERARQMDEFNNIVGVNLVTAEDAAHGVSGNPEQVMAQRVLDAMSRGEVVVLEGSGGLPRRTRATDLPPNVADAVRNLAN